MTNDEYQKATQEFAVYPKDQADIYLILGLASEAGEVAGKMKKYLRGDYAEDTKTIAEDLDAEIGDCLYYISQYCNESGTSIGALMELNISKLKDRRERNVIRGSGDNR